jgi:molecular chaperone GrpE
MSDDFLREREGRSPQTEEVGPASEQPAGPEGGPAEATAGVSVEELERQLSDARAEAQANWDRFLRARADLENYRRRAERTLSEAERTAKRGLLLKLLGVLDNLERATEYEHVAMSGENAEANALVTGLRMTLWQLRQVLESEGVKPIEAVGRPFDPYLHEAVGTVETTEVEENTIVDEVQKGYLYGDEVLRPAKVRVAVRPQQA